MEGKVTESMINYLDKYNVQVFILLMGMVFITLGVLFYVWIANRRKFHQYKHQIPASVLKNYLDSIIQNSTALKSSLFRGGGLDIDASGVPSVLPLDKLQAGAAIDIESGGDEALKAEISRLQNALNEKNNVIKELEEANRNLEGDNKNKTLRIAELEKMIEELKAQISNMPQGAGEGASGESAELLSQLNELKISKSELEEQLKEYEIIGDDLANLKTIKQENEQLKKALNDIGHNGAAAPEENVGTPIVETTVEPEPEPEVEASTPASEPAEEPVEETVAASPATEEPAAESPEEAVEASPEEQEEKEVVNTKTPEDLLSEFEKMLG